VLVIDIGGTNVKVRASHQHEKRKFASGPALTPKQMMSGIRKLVADWDYDVVSIGYPGAVLRNRPLSEPWNLGKGWIGFNFEAAFKRPTKVINDAAMQALGNYRRGRMLFLGLGTGLGSALIIDGIVEPMELGHLPYKRATFEDYVGIRGLKKHGKKKWRRYVADVVERLIAAVEPDQVVLGGGNAKLLKEMPRHCRVGDNTNAFLGGFRLWQEAGEPSVTHHRIAKGDGHPIIRGDEGRRRYETERRNVVASAQHMAGSRRASQENRSHAIRSARANAHRVSRREDQYHRKLRGAAHGSVRAEGSHHSGGRQKRHA
jgi:polyphosphate glucokinase